MCSLLHLLSCCAPAMFTPPPVSVHTRWSLAEPQTDSASFSPFVIISPVCSLGKTEVWRHVLRRSRHYQFCVLCGWCMARGGWFVRRGALKKQQLKQLLLFWRFLVGALIFDALCPALSSSLSVMTRVFKVYYLCFLTKWISGLMHKVISCKHSHLPV